MSRGLRLLYVLPNVPSRVRVRPFNLIRELSARHEITALCLVPSPDEERDVVELARYCRVHTVPLSRREALRRCARAALSPVPLWVAYFASTTLRARLHQLLDGAAVDVAHLEHIKTAHTRAVLAPYRLPVVYDAVDCATLYLTRRYRSIPLSQPPQKALWGSELHKMRPYEGAVVRGCDVTLANSPVDRTWLARLAGPRADVRTLCNGTDLCYFQPWSAAREAGRLTFCAKLDYFPNVQAALFLVREVMPRVWAAEPGARLTIAGSNPGPEVRRLARDSRVTVTGYVPDVRPHVGGAQVALCPLLVKAGIQNKILEAMALGTPVVATALGAEGLAARPGEHLLTADSPDALAAAIVRLLRDPDLRQALSRAGRRFVEWHHDWAAAAGALEAIYADLCATTTRGRRG